MNNLNLIGRQWIVAHKDSSTFEGCNKIEAISQGKCNRCGSDVHAKLPSGKIYCRSCIGIGRIVEGDYLVRYDAEYNFPQLKQGALVWDGQLTPLQQKISDTLIENYRAKKSSLVHAVTGAGKTEMLFKLIAECLARGERACIATPRIDVVNELYPRFTKAFAIEIGKYHGREYHEPKNEQLIICTTHQLMKYFHAFDLLVIDEVDSFPYVGNKQLHYAAENAVKPNGVRKYLTATPTTDLLEEVKKGQLELLKLNRRFHGHLLPVPKEKLFLRPFITSKGLNKVLVKEIINAIKAGHPLLLFVPRVDEIPDYLKFLKKIPELKQVSIAGVHASDLHRLEKVQDFRVGKTQLLVTTTILERGVTFKHVWVIVVAADDQIYTSHSLVQIAGRVGRAKSDPTGMIMYCYHKYTKNLRLAMKQIREMNK